MENGNLSALLWILLPVFIAAGSALLSFYVMQARMEVAVAKEREALAEANALVKYHQQVVEERVRAAEESVRRQTFDKFLGEFRVEERHYLKENKSAEHAKKSMVLQERLYFRNIPLSNWVEHEMTIEEGGDPGRLPAAASVFNTRGLGESDGDQIAMRLLQ
ncbi:MAG TPA: hypothetical protein DEH78_33375 [Solibacterales bacterium]|nr:hypothetical protein [Bryobacterales bacterium]